MAAVAVNSFSHERDQDKDRPAPAPGINDVSAVFHRRIEFQAERKPFTGFNEKGNSGFKLVTLNPNSNPNLNSGSNSEPKKGAFAGSGKEVALERGRSGVGMDPELSFSITFRRIGAGLQNLGNTCFLNSVLQCLTYTQPLAAYLQSGRHIASCRKAGFCALCAIQKHVRVALESSGRILAPKDLVSNLRCISRTFRNARQEDAHEYMVNLLESMHKCCLPSGMPSESPGAYEKSLVHKIFGGRLRSRVKCTQCSFCSDKFDPFLDLSLEIARLDSLQKALTHFTAPEELDGGEKHYQCQRCKKKVRALKQLSIDKPPEVLAIHLKRFGSHNPGQKIDRQIHFSPTLDLKPFVTGPYDGNLKYTLYGVLVHHGWSTHSGHYYCFVRTSTGMWYSLDDNRVVQVNEKRVLEQKAYMLFYVRDRTFSLSKKTAEVMHKESVGMNASGRVLSNGSQGLKGNMSKGIIEKKLNDSLSAEVAQEQTPKPPMSKEIQMKRDSHLKSSSPTTKVDSLCNGSGPVAEADSHGNGNALTAEVNSHKDCNSPSKEHPSGNPLKVSSALGLGNALPVESSNVEKCAVSSLKDSESVDLSNCAKEACITGLQVPVIKHDDSNGFHSSVSKREPASSVSPSDNKVAVKGVTGPSNSSGHLDISIPKETKNAEKVGSSNTTGLADDLSAKKADDSSIQKADGVEAVVKSSQRRKKALDVKLHTVKGKPLKQLISAKKLSKSIIFGASFVRRKRRHRTETPTKVGKNNSQSDLGPSTSEESKASSVKIRKRRVKRGSNDKNFEILGKRKLAENDEACDDSIIQNGISTTCLSSSLTSNGISGGSIIQNGTGPSSSLASNGKSDAAVSGGSEHKQRDLGENGLVNMLTRDETTVARWDGVQHPSAFVESRSEKSLRIGYVGDEWDEEYDAGKRKKIRNSSIIFDGSNPFQALATRKAKANHGKVNRNSSANQPFRI